MRLDAHDIVFAIVYDENMRTHLSQAHVTCTFFKIPLCASSGSSKTFRGAYRHLYFKCVLYCLDDSSKKKISFLFHLISQSI